MDMDTFKFSSEYKNGIFILFLFTFISLVLGLAVEHATTPKEFVDCVDITNQPNCVVGAYCMYAKYTLGTELSIKNLTNSYPTLGQSTVGISTISTIWNDLFPTNQLKCIYDISKDESFTNGIAWKKPYIWVGRWDDNTNSTEYHTCIIKFYQDSVVFKHFVMNPKTHTNYTVRANYEFFFQRTYRIYTLK